MILGLVGSKFLNWRVLVACGIAIILSFAWIHYQGLVNENKVLRENFSRLQTAYEIQVDTIKAQEGAIEEWRQAQAKFEKHLEVLKDEARRAENETRRLRRIFAENDLGVLATAKPGLVENSANDGSDRLIGLLQCATGARSEQCSD